MPTTEPRSRGRRSPFVAVGVVIAAGLFTLVTTTGRPLQPLLLYDGPGYLEIAEHVLANGSLPPIDLRPPLYPLVLSAFMRLAPQSALRDVVLLQAACWVASAVLVAVLAYQLSGSAVVAALGGVAYTTLSDAQFFVRLVYAEAIGVTAALAAAAALVAGLRHHRSGVTLLWAAAVLATVAAYTRAVFQVLLPLFALLVLVDALSTRRPAARRVLPFVAALVMALAPWYAAHQITRGSAFFTKQGGYCLANYLGDRRLLGRFGDDFAGIERAYAARFAATPQQRFVGWWELAPEWPALYQARTGAALDPDRVHADMARTALTILSRNPAYWATRWLETWTEFSTHPGWSPKGDWSPIRLAWPGWRLYFTYCGAWLPLVLLAGEVWGQVRARGAGVWRLVPIGIFAVAALANTAIEPWPGQNRYRAALDGFLLAALLGFAAHAFARWRRPPEVSLQASGR